MDDREYMIRRDRWDLVSWCFEPSQPQRITSGQRQVGIGRTENTR